MMDIERRIEYRRDRNLLDEIGLPGLREYVDITTLKQHGPPLLDTCRILGIVAKLGNSVCLDFHTEG